MNQTYGLRRISLLASALILATVVACTPASRNDNDKPVVIASFTVLADLTRMVTDDLASVRSLTAAGAEVEEWELTPSNFADIERADLIFYNGYELETWIRQVQSTALDSTPIVAVAEETGLPTLPIIIGEMQGNPDPHLWMDPRNAASYITVIRDHLISIDPDNKQQYQDNAESAQQQLVQLYQNMTEALRVIPQKQRRLITTEAAFSYLTEALGFEHDGIWGINSEEEGTPQQMARIVDIVSALSIPAVFYESTTSPRHIQTVADETGVSVAGPLYIDSVDEPGSGADTYIGMQQRNVELILQNLQE